MEKSYQNFKSSEEGQAFIEQKKIDIIAETKYVEKSKRYHIALKAFKSARNFYGGFMKNSFLSELALLMSFETIVPVSTVVFLCVFNLCT